MEIEIKDLVYIGVILLSGGGIFFGARYKLSEKIQLTKEELKDKIKEIEIEIERLKGKDENQQQINYF